MAKKSSYNPTGDDNVEAGYQQHQKETEEKRNAEKGKIPPDEVKESVDTHHAPIRRDPNK